MSKLLKNTTLYTIGHVLPKAAQFLLLPLYSRYLNPSDYGIVQSMAVLSVILTIFFTMALDRSIYRLYFNYQSKKDKKDYLGTVYVGLLIISSLILLILLLGHSVVSKIFSSIPFYPYYAYAIFTVYFTIFGILPKVYFQVEQKADKFIVISIMEFVVSTAFIIYFVVFASKGASGMLLGRLVQSLIFLPVYVYIMSSISNFCLKGDILKESLSYSWPLVPAMLSAWILNFSDRIFIEHFFTLEDVGLYSLSYKLAQILLIFSISFNKAYEPLFFQLANQANQVESKTRLFKYNKVYSLFLIYLALAISLFSKEFVFLLDAKYHNAHKLVPIIVVGILIGQVGGLFNRSIYQDKKTKQIMLLIIISAGLNIGMNYIFVPRYGPYGAALATMLTFLIFFIIKYLYAKKCYYIPTAWKEIIPSFAILLASIFFFNSVELSFLLGILLKVSLLSVSVILLFIRYKNTLSGVLTFRLRNSN